MTTLCSVENIYHHLFECHSGIISQTMGAIVAIPNMPCGVLFLFLERRHRQPAAILVPAKLMLPFWQATSNMVTKLSIKRYWSNVLFNSWVDPPLGVHYSDVTWALLRLTSWDRWRLGLDKSFHPTRNWACDYSSVLGFKLINVS